MLIMALVIIAKKKKKKKKPLKGEHPGEALNKS